MTISHTAVRPEAVERIRSAGVLLLFFVGSTLVIMAGSALAQEHFTGWYAAAEKAPWEIPPWLRASLWLLFHIGMTVAAWLVWLERRQSRVSSPLSLYGTQLLLHAAWRPALFSLYPAVGGTALWLGGVIMLLLVITVAVAFVEFSKVSRVAGLLVVPYLCWTIYILSLNIGLIALN